MRLKHLHAARAAPAGYRLRDATVPTAALNLGG